MSAKRYEMSTVPEIGLSQLSAASLSAPGWSMTSPAGQVIEP